VIKAPNNNNKNRIKMKKYNLKIRLVIKNNKKISLKYKERRKKIKKANKYKNSNYKKIGKNYLINLLQICQNLTNVLNVKER
jgi:hypothetical protein